MSAHRKNTLVVDFSTLPKRPVLDQVEEFLKKHIKLDMADVKSIQLHHLDNCVFIEMNNSSVAPRLHKQHHLQHSFIYEGVDYYVPVYVDGPTTTVKIHDLPPQMPNSHIINNLQQYGKVLSIQNEVWKNFFSGIPNGVRVVRMRIVKPLPVYVTVDNYRSYVSYPKEPQRTSPTASAKQAKQHVPSSTNSEQNSNSNQFAPPSAHSESSDNSTDDDDDGMDEDGNSNSNEQDNQYETATEPNGKRRLSTDTSNSGTKDENEPKRSCSQSRKIDEKGNNSEWKVYHTRSRRKNESDVK